MKVTKNLYIYLLFSVLSIGQCSYAAATGQRTSLSDTEWDDIQAFIDEDNAKILATYLTNYNISLNARTPHTSKLGQTLLMKAAIQNKPAVAEYLLKKGADKSLIDYENKTALQWAISTGSIKVSPLLNDAPVATEQVDAVILPIMRRSSDNPDRLAPLYTPIYISVDELLAAKKGADKSLMDWQKNTAQAWARSRGAVNVSHLLNPPVAAAKVDEVILPNIRGNDNRSRERLVEFVRYSSDGEHRLVRLGKKQYMTLDQLLAEDNVFVIKR